MSAAAEILPVGNADAIGGTCAICHGIARVAINAACGWRLPYCTRRAVSASIALRVHLEGCACLLSRPHASDLAQLSLAAGVRS